MMRRVGDLEDLEGWCQVEQAQPTMGGSVPSESQLAFTTLKHAKRPLYPSSLPSGS